MSLRFIRNEFVCLALFLQIGNAYKCGSENRTVLNVCEEDIHNGKTVYINFQTAQNSTEYTCSCAIYTRGDIGGIKFMSMEIKDTPNSFDCGSEAVFDTQFSKTYIRCTTTFPVKIFQIKTGFHANISFNRLSKPFSADYCIKFNSGYDDTFFRCSKPNQFTKPKLKNGSHKTDKLDITIIVSVAVSSVVIVIAITVIIICSRKRYHKDERTINKRSENTENKTVNIEFETDHEIHIYDTVSENIREDEEHKKSEDDRKTDRNNRRAPQGSGSLTDRYTKAPIGQHQIDGDYLCPVYRKTKF